ncbi:hypothetical protein Gohar_008848, partial [Gossypium harknessii]|nr:hypothetical protein [Gossypium harknessii]
MEYRSAGCTEEYNVMQRDLEHAGEEESVLLEGDIGGGLVLQRQITVPKDNPKVLRIESSILARKVGAGSGGFSRLVVVVLIPKEGYGPRFKSQFPFRLPPTYLKASCSGSEHMVSRNELVCLRVHPTFSLLHPTETFVAFTSVDGTKQEVWPETGEKVYQGNLLPNGEWKLVDKCLGLVLINRFNVGEVYKCLIHWGARTVNLELWSEDRPVSKQSPLQIFHEYELYAMLKCSCSASVCDTYLDMGTKPGILVFRLILRPSSKSIYDNVTRTLDQGIQVDSEAFKHSLGDKLILRPSSALLAT